LLTLWRRTSRGMSAARRSSPRTPPACGEPGSTRTGVPSRRPSPLPAVYILSPTGRCGRNGHAAAAPVAGQDAEV